MKPGEHEFDHGQPFGGVDAHGNAAPVVAHGQRAVGVDFHFDAVGKTAQGFVSGVVDDFLTDVRRAVCAGVHAGAFFHRLQAFEHGDAGFGILAVSAHGGVAACGKKGAYSSTKPAPARAARAHGGFGAEKAVPAYTRMTFLKTHFNEVETQHTFPPQSGARVPCRITNPRVSRQTETACVAAPHTLHRVRHGRNIGKAV